MTIMVKYQWFYINKGEIEKILIHFMKTKRKLIMEIYLGNIY